MQQNQVFSNPNSPNLIKDKKSQNNYWIAGKVIKVKNMKNNRMAAESIHTGGSTQIHD